ncbi:MAG TPA: HAD family hydrolase [Gemmataceae bacterium]|jgi:HAD superfamily hydrolase (TIGR01509 family)
MPVRGVIFDLDGTLVDTNWQHVEAWRRAFAACGHDVPAERIVAEVGKGGDQLLPSVLGRAAADRDGKKVSRLYTETFKTIAGRERFAVQPGAVDLLDELRRRGLKTALATSSPQDLLKAILASAGVDFTKHVDVTVTADDAGASKPAPDVVLVAVDKLGLRPEECAMVGDTPFDAEACVRAHVTCWGVACGGCYTAEQLRGAGAAAVWGDPADLLDHLDEALAG